MSLVATNNKKIKEAFEQMVTRKQAYCLASLSTMMKEAVKYAMEIHLALDFDKHNPHKYHSEIVEHDFGWCVAYNGQVMEMGMGAGTEVPGRYSEMFDMLSAPQKGWYGLIIAIIEPLQIGPDQFLYYSARFEEKVFNAIADFTRDNFLEIFKKHII